MAALEHRDRLCRILQPFQTHGTVVLHAALDARVLSLHNNDLTGLLAFVASMQAADLDLHTYL